MRPELRALGSTRHDLLVIGGGILGACLAWDAALRGLKVALVERGELGAATSANSLRIIHGGLRYLVRDDLRRMRESIRERSASCGSHPAWSGPSRSPSPSGIPGYPTRTGLRLALALNDVLSAGRNRHLVPARHLPPDGPFQPGAAAPVPGLGTLARAGEPCGLTPSCLAPNTLSGRLCARPQNMAVWWSTMLVQNFSPAAGGRVLSVAIRDCQSGASRRSWPDNLSWLRARGR